MDGGTQLSGQPNCLVCFQFSVGTLPTNVTEDIESRKTILTHVKSCRFVTPAIRALAEAKIDHQNATSADTVQSTIDEIYHQSYIHFSAAPVGRHHSDSSESSAKIPQELINMIIDHLHDDFQALRACSVVHSSWVPACRDHIFTSVAFHMLFDLEEWADAFPSPQESPAWHVQSLHLAGLWASIVDEDFNPDKLDEVLLEHFRSFNRVRKLSLLAFKLPPPSSLHHFDHLRSSLRSLELYGPLPSRRSHLLHFISSFPNLEDLVISGISSWEEEKTPDAELLSSLQIYPPFRGNLKLVDLNDPSGEFLDLLLNFPITVSFRAMDMNLEESENFNLKPVSELLSSCASTLETLKLGQSFCDGPDAITLERNTALRNLSLTILAWRPFSCIWLNHLLSNISSPHMSTLILRFMFSSQSTITRQFKLNDWDALDSILVDLILRGTLRKVMVHVVNEPGNPTRQEPLEMIQRALGRLGSMGAEKVEFGTAIDSRKPGFSMY